MSTNKDPRRLPVYIDRVNNRLLADPQNGGPWFVVSVGGGGGSIGPGSLTEAGILQLDDSVNSNSTSRAATPNAVRQAFSLAETANNAAQGAASNATTALNNSQAAVNTANSISGTANTALSTANAAVSTANAASATATNAANAVNSKLDITGGTITGDLIFGHLGRLGFEGTTDNAFETYLAVVDPTADRTITFPNASGNVPLLETSNTWSSTQVFQSSVNLTNANVSSQLYIGPAASIAFEGTTDDGFETFLSVTDPTADRSIFLPNASGTIALLQNLSTVAISGSYNDLTGRPTLGTSAALNVASSGNASASEVVRGNDTRLSSNIGYTAATRSLTSSTGTGATLPLFTATDAGLAPASGGGTTKYLRADGTYEVPPGAALTDGDRGDISISNGGTTWTIDNGVVSYAKMQAVSTGNRILGKAGATPGPIEEIPCSQVGRDIIGAADTATQRTLLGLGALAQQDSLGFITSFGAVGTLAGRPLITTTGGTVTTGTFGISAGTFCEGNDSRLSDSRTTPGVLTLASNGTGSAPGSTFNGSTSRTISYNSIGASADDHVHGNISRGGAIGTTSGLPIITGSGGILQAGSFGTSIGTFCQGNDSRLSDSRTTPNTLTFDNSGFGAASGSTFNGSAARTISWNTVGAASSGHGHGQITNGGAIGSVANLPIITGVNGVLQVGSFGTTANTFCQGNDSRLSDTRNTANSITLSSAGTGSAPGATFNGSSPVTISYNSIGAQQALGYTPVQQGGGTGQFASNKLYIGWDNNSRLRLQIDTTNYGGTWPIDINGNAATVTGGVYTTGNQSISGIKTFLNQVRTADGTAAVPAYSFGSSSNSGFWRDADNFVNFSLSGVQRASLGAGEFYFSNNRSTNAGVQISNPGVVRIGNDAQADGWGFIQFLRSGVNIGGVAQVGTTGVSFNTSSDYRLKENVLPVSQAVDRLKSLRPCQFNFTSEPGRVISGFVAHELQEVLPEAVTGEKDATESIGNLADADGCILQENVPRPATLEAGQTWVATGERPVYQGVDQSKVVPLLTAALQEAIGRIEQLEALVNP